jgi:hypothetical protein
MAHCLHHAADLTISAFGNGDPVPAIRAIATAILYALKLSQPIVELDSVEQTLFFLVAQGAQHPHGILALQTKPRVHEAIGQLTRIGEQQQTFGVEVQPPYRLPLARVQAGKASKNGGAVLWIIVGHHLTGRLVVSQHAWRGRRNTHPDRLAIDLHGIAILNALPNMGWLAVDRDTAFQNHLLHLQPRAQTGLRQDFVKLGCISMWLKHTLGGQRWILLIGRSIKPAGHHFIEGDSLSQRRLGSALQVRNS